MTEEEQKKWEPLIKRWPELAGVAYEIYLRHEKKDANLTTYFKWAAKRQKQEEVRYRMGLQKFCVREITTMEYEDGNETNKLFL